MKTKQQAQRSAFNDDDAGYSLGDILRDALRIKEDNKHHFRHYEALTQQYEAAGLCNA